MTTETSKPKTRGPKVGTDRSARAAAQTAEFGQVRQKAFDLNLSIAGLCEMAGVPFGTVKAWKNHFPRTLNAQDQLGAILALPLGRESSAAE